MRSPCRPLVFPAAVRTRDLPRTSSPAEEGEGALDEDLIAPIISLTVDQDEFPIALSAIFDPSTLDTDRVYIVVSANENMSSPLLETYDLVGTGANVFAGLDAFDDSDGPLYIEEYIWRAGSYGPRSNKLIWGDPVAPEITSSASPTAVENTANPTVALTADKTVTWAITGGADQASFSVNATTGVLTLNATPNYEVKSSYVVAVTATALNTLTDTQTITLGITDQDEIPSGLTFTDVTGADLSDVENFSYTVAGLGSGVTVPWSISSGTATKNGSGAAASGACVNDDVLAFTITASGSYLTGVSKTLTVGAGSDTATVTTMSDPSAVGWAAEAAPAVNDEGFGSATSTFTGINFGVGLGIVMVSTSFRFPTGVTVGGTACDFVGYNDNGQASIWQIDIASAGAKTVVVTSYDALSLVAISTGTMTGANPTATDTASLAFGYHANPSTTSSSLDVSAGGIGLCVIRVGANIAVTWNTGTEETEVGGTDFKHSTARFTASATPSADAGSGSDTAMFAAAWGPE